MGAEMRMILEEILGQCFKASGEAAHHCNKALAAGEAQPIRQSRIANRWIASLRSQ